MFYIGARIHMEKEETWEVSSLGSTTAPSIQCRKLKLNNLHSPTPNLLDNCLHESLIPHCKREEGIEFTSWLLDTEETASINAPP
jgi:hypothetical protein